MKIHSEKGFALPLVMLAILVGALVIPAFLGYVGTSLISSRNYADVLDAQYACDSGAEHAIWSLVEDDIADSIDDEGEYISYALDEQINGLATNVKISNAWEVIAWDNFESGGFTGGGGWLANWTSSGYADVTTSDPYEGAYHLRLRSSTGVVSRAVDLSKQVNAHLRFWAQVNSFEPTNTVDCRVSRNGIDWTVIKTWAQSDSGTGYHYYDFDITSYGMTNPFYISFKANMNSTGDSFYVDDLNIVWPATDVEQMALETFESGNWTGGEGWLGDWAHTGTSSITNTGTPNGGSYHLMLQSGDGYAERATDLSSLSVAHLQFWAKVVEFEGGDNAYVRVSSDGVEWSDVLIISNGGTEGSYVYYDIDLSDYELTDEFIIAFDAEMSKPDDYFYIDDISINAIRAYCITVTAGDRILKVAVDLMGGAENVLCWYFIV